VGLLRRAASWFLELERPRRLLGAVFLLLLLLYGFFCLFYPAPPRLRRWKILLTNNQEISFMAREFRYVGDRCVLFDERGSPLLLCEVAAIMGER
jgi:hypothetical protein